MTEPSLSGPVVVLRGVSKRFGNGTLALEGMGLEVAGGEIVTLLGPSGCGKSTTLRIAAGLAAPSSGEVSWPSSRLDARGRPRGDVGFVFQEPTLMPWRTVFGNVHLPLRLKGVSRRAGRERVMAGLKSVGLGDVAGAFPRELSGGMRMRVSIARALVTGPRLLVMDEPFAALDEIARQRLNDDVLRLRDETGVAVAFVTHSVYEAAYLSSRILVMRPRPGRVHAEIVPGTDGGRGAAYRTSEPYLGVCRAVSDALAEAMAAGKEEA